MGRSIRSLRFAAAIGIAALCCIEAASAQTACPEAKVTAFDGGVFQNHGRAVAISGDTALVGAHWDNDQGTQSGSAYVYQREPGLEGSWVFAQKLLASDGGGSEHFGRSVAIDGNTIMVGALNHLHDADGGNGAVYVFKYDPDTSRWIERQELVASDGAIGDGFGVSVSISGDVALIGAPSDDDDGFASGSVYVFRFDPKTSQWIEGQKLTASDAMTSDGFGGSVALAGDLAVIGTPGQDGVEEETGAAYVFRFDSDSATWIEQAKVFASDGTVLDRFGWSVAVSPDSIGVAIVGARLDGAGSAYVFRYDPKSSTWFEEQKLVPSGGSPEQFGRAVAMDGDTALIGSPFADAVGYSSGAAYVFRYDGDTSQWSQADMLVPDPGPWTAWFGFSVALDGDRAVCGAHGEDQQRGAAYMYNLAPNCNCPQDLDLDGNVGASDLLALLVSWGPCPPNADCPADFDGNGTVGASDLLALLVNWGPCP